MILTNEIKEEIVNYTHKKVKELNLHSLLIVPYGSYAYKDDPYDIDVVCYVKERYSEIISKQAAFEEELEKGLRVNLIIRSMETLINQANHGVSISLKTIFAKDVLEDKLQIHPSLKELFSFYFLFNSMGNIIHREFSKNFDQIEDKRLIYLMEYVSFFHQLKTIQHIDIDIRNYYRDHETLSKILNKLLSNEPLTIEDRRMVYALLDTLI